MKYSHSHKNFFKIKLFTNGKVEVEEVNSTNFHPSQVNEILQMVSEKGDYCYTISDEKNIEKNKLKIVKHQFRKAEKDLSVAKKQYDYYKRAFDKIQNKEENENSGS